MKDIKDIIKDLPSSWDEVTLETFQKLTTVLVTEEADGFAGVENSIAIISKLTDIPVEQLEEFSLRDLQALGNKISFMVELPKERKGSITKWKSIDEITYNNYITFIKIPEDKHLENLHVFVKQFSKTELTEEEILKLSVPDVLHGFFLFRKKFKRLLKRLIRWQRLKIIQGQAKETVQGLKRRIISLSKPSTK